MPRDDTAYLLDMLLAARDAVSFAEGMSYADFARDRRTQLSILKSVEIVGEAASRLSEDTRPKFPPFYTWKIVLSHLFSYRKGLRCEILCSHVGECYLS